MSPDTNYGLGSRLAHNVESSVDIDARSAGTCGQRAAAASPGRVVAATVAFALVHSALASRGAKAAAVTLLGARRRNGLYRAFFNTQAALMSAALASYLRELPDRDLYTVRYPAAALMRAGQAAGVLLLLDAVRHIGVTRVTGISSVLSLARGDDAVAAEPEAQGPRIQEDGRLRIGGAFTRSRHPLNLAAVPILWLNPRMTRNLAVFSALATAYLWLGSWHEERRLVAAYGEAYRSYLNARVPFFFGPPTLLSDAGSTRQPFR